MQPAIVAFSGAQTVITLSKRSTTISWRTVLWGSFFKVIMPIRLWKMALPSLSGLQANFSFNFICLAAYALIFLSEFLIFSQKRNLVSFPLWKDKRLAVQKKNDYRGGRDTIYLWWSVDAKHWLVSHAWKMRMLCVRKPRTSWLMNSEGRSCSCAFQVSDTCCHFSKLQGVAVQL